MRIGLKYIAPMLAAGAAAVFTAAVGTAAAGTTAVGAAGPVGGLGSTEGLPW